MRICLMIEGQEGVTWEQWRALALRGRGRRARGPLPLRPLPLDPARRAGRVARRLGDARRARRDTPTRIRLGTMVSPVTFRPASVLAKNAVTVDHVSGGRVELGIGAGWYEAEHEVLRLPVRHRPASASTSSTASSPRSTASGRTASDAWPKPLQRPRPPIIVGGAAKPRSVRAAVAFADEYNTTFASVDDARARRRAVDDAAREAGREPLVFSMMCGCVVGRDQRGVRATVSRAGARSRGSPTCTRPLFGTVDEVAERLRDYEAVGVERAMLQHLAHEDLEMVALLGDLAASLVLGPSSGPNLYARRRAAQRATRPRTGLVCCGTGATPGPCPYSLKRRHDLVLGATLPVHPLDHRQHPVLFVLVAGVQPPHLRR